MFHLLTYRSPRVISHLVSTFLLVLSLSPVFLFAQDEDRGARSERDERRREWRPGGPDGGGRWEDRREGRGRRDGWNPEEFLKRLDANGDGKLESSEMSDRTQRYLSGLGFDTSKAIQLTAVVDKIRADRGESTSVTKKENEAERRVPGFGATNEKVPGFSSSSDEENISEFGEEINRQVEWVLENYDKNKNNVLEQSEQVEIPAGAPPLAESDTNRDGKLSRLEMANRYRARAQYSRRNEGESRNSERGSSRQRREDSNGESKSRGRFAAEPSAGSNRSRSRGSNSRSVSSTEDRTQKDRVADSSQIEKTARYVDNIINKYDTDKDGKLSATEIKESGIRNPPKADEEGFVTRDAYVNFLINPQGSTPNSSSAENVESSAKQPASGESSRSNRESLRGERRRSTGSSNGSSSTSQVSRKVTFDDYDEDGNGMIEMHEFSQEWDDQALEQFYQKDKNRDGVITAKEWKGY
jgi:hypothetical protein